MINKDIICISISFFVFYILFTKLTQENENNKSENNEQIKSEKEPIQSENEHNKSENNEPIQSFYLCSSNYEYEDFLYL